jgi:hypothetical protein
VKGLANTNNKQGGVRFAGEAGLPLLSWWRLQEKLSKLYLERD